MESFTNVTCPFCSLLCDDLSVRSAPRQLEVSANACRLARQGFAAPRPAAEASIKGVAASVDQAAKTAARILQTSGKPLIAGLGADINGLRAALQLAETLNAALLHSQEAQTLHNLKALQARGGIMTTLAEVKNRADTVILVGADVTGAYPRFIERFVKPPHSLFVGDDRKLAYLGKPGRTELQACTDPAPVVLSCRADEIADNLALLRAGLAGRRLPELPASKQRNLNRIAAMIRNAEYGVMVWSPASLPHDHADLIISSLLDLLRNLNAEQRFAGLSLGGGNGGVSFQNVATWQTGFPAAINFHGGCPSGAGARLEDVDSLLWISGFTDESPPALETPRIVLSPYDTDAEDADVYIPVGVPGIDHAGNLFRTDGVVSLPLKKLRDSGAASAADVIHRILFHIAGKSA